MSERVCVYGSDHSPWVQTVLLALQHQGMPFDVIQFPISVSSYLRLGMVMPVCKWPDGSIHYDSFDIMAEIAARHKISNTILTDREQALQDQSRLERFFISYVLLRGRWGNKLRFVHAWAKTAPTHPNGVFTLLSHFSRATMTMYFFSLIQGGIWSQRLKKRPLYSQAFFCKELKYWSSRLGDRKYFGGENPNYLDYAMLGQIQCIASGLTDGLFVLLQKQSILVSWLERMHATIDNYPRMYSQRLFNEEISTLRSSKLGFFVFYLSVFCHLVLLPITILFLLHALLSRRKNPSRTTGKLNKTFSSSAR